MGQYHITVNLDKKEFLHPHVLGDGLKLAEQVGGSEGGVATALVVLLAASNGRGGGDFADKTVGDERVVGRWAGDRIAIVGDYAETGDFKEKEGDPSAGDVYSLCLGEGATFRNISPLLADYMETLGVAYIGDGWRRRLSLWDVVAGLECTYYGDEEHGRIAVIGGQQCWQKDVVAALAKTDYRANDEKFTLAELRALGLRVINEEKEG